MDPDDGGTDQADHHTRNLRRERARGQVRIWVWDGAATTPWFEYWRATPDELAAAVAESAWTLKALERDPAGPGCIARLRC